MVAVSLSEEVRPLPLAQEAAATPDAVGGTTTPAATTGIESVDDHIARLKANARQHVDRELNQSKSPYLPSKEVAKTIKCRFFPNCYYGDKCMFYHPSSLEASTNGHEVAVPPMMGMYQPMPFPNGGVQSPTSQDNGNLPLSPNGLNQPEEYGGNGYEMGYNPNGPQNGYYIPNGYEPNGEYNPYAPQGQGGPSSQSSQQQQGQGQYYGFVPYGAAGPHAGYVPYGVQQPHQNGYYPQGGAAGAYQGMYMSPPPPAHQQFGGAVQGSPVHQNGVTSPAGSSNAPIPDPAIIAQGPESTANGQEAATPANGETAATSSGMEKTLSNQSNKSSSSSKSKKAKKAAAASTNGAVNGQTASAADSQLAQQAQEFVPMQQQYYGMGPGGMPIMPSEMMMMMPPPPHMHQQHFQPQAYGSFAPHMNGVMNGNASGSPVENGVTSPSSAAPAVLSTGAATNGDKKAHERIPSLTSGQLHTFFQTSGDSSSSSTAAAPSSAPRGASSAPIRVNGAPSSAPATNGGARFNPSSSTNSHPKRFPPSQFSPTGAPLPRSGPVSNPNHIRGGPRGHLSNGSFDANSHKSTLPCRYFESRSCRHGDLCHYTHLLIEERAIPDCEPPRMTRDARLLGLNIGSPDGRISDTLPKHPGEFGPGPGHGHGPSGRRLTLNGHNGAPNGFNGVPNVNAKGRFVHPAQPSTQAFAAQQQQQQAQQSQAPQQAQAQQEQKQQQIAALAGSNSADAQEKIQRLISETRNLPSSIPPPANAAQNGPRANGPRQSAAHPAPQPLGGAPRRPPPHSHNGPQRGPHGPTSHSHATSQRVPSGEKDFPALSASAGPASASGRAASMERSTSASSSVEKKSDNKEETAAPVAAAEAKKDETPAQDAKPAPASTAAPAAPAAAPAPAPAAASAKPVFSWASAAAKAASLPTPPPKRPAAKQRPSTKGDKNDSSKGEKAEKSEKKEKAQKEKETTPAPAPKTAASVLAAAAPAATSAAVEPVSAAA